MSQENTTSGPAAQTTPAQTTPTQTEPQKAAQPQTTPAQTTPPQKILLKDYSAPTFEIKNTDLFFNLFEDHALVQNKMIIKTLVPNSNLFLNGSDLELLSIKLTRLQTSELSEMQISTSTQSSHKKTKTIQTTTSVEQAQELKVLNSEDSKSICSYQKTKHSLTILNPPEEFLLETLVKIKPQENTRLEGLYRSQDMFLTQCEANGFQRITYFMDRPDVMTQFKVRIEADHKKYPILLSNGNLIETKTLDNGRHQVVWEDPFKKACYLFALFAGNCGKIQDEFITASKRKVSLEIYAPHGFETQCVHAMESLKLSMKWDEERFGREYDLSRYMIVTTHDFNAGAMENKGLNIFNSKYILADPKTATDDDYFHVQSVVAHEYFHNWTGNRVTLRDWFHLSLKEGLTVFRDQEFSMDMSNRSLVRIDSVRSLRDRQFAEDAGPNAHPIRPESCYAVDNFYTSTIYEKGAEVIRMMQTLVGRPGFRKGMDLYFERHDGQAVIIEDFAKCIADANQIDLEQFKLWYSQAGTPEVKAIESYNAQEKIYQLSIEQNCRPTPDQEHKKPFYIPLVIGLLKEDGSEWDLEDSPALKNSEGQYILHVKEKTQTFTFRNIDTKPILSLNRQFSAPINLSIQRMESNDQDLQFLFSKDPDEFNQWEAGQVLYSNFLKNSIHQKSANDGWLFSLKNILTNPKISNGMKAELLSLPSDSYLLQNEHFFDADKFFNARKDLKKKIALELKNLFLEIYHNLHGKNIYSRNSKDFGDRSLKNTILNYLSLLDDCKKLPVDQFKSAQIMTDQLQAFAILCSTEHAYKETALEEFYHQWKDNTLVLNTWFSMQAMSTDADTLLKVQKLWNHPLFDKKNPNRVYSLLLRFAMNLVRFHAPPGKSYPFYAEALLEVDGINPQVAARAASGFNIVEKLPPPLQALATEQLLRMKKSKLSPNTYEIITKCLSSVNQ